MLCGQAANLHEQQKPTDCFWMAFALQSLNMLASILNRSGYVEPSLLQFQAMLLFDKHDLLLYLCICQATILLRPHYAPPTSPPPPCPSTACPSPSPIKGLSIDQIVKHSSSFAAKPTQAALEVELRLQSSNNSTLTCPVQATLCR